MLYGKSKASLLNESESLTGDGTILAVPLYLFADSGFIFAALMHTRIKKYIAVSSLLSLLCLTAAAQRREVSVKGTVRDKETGRLLSGATIADINDGTLTLSNDSGQYTISVKDGDHLVFSYISYHSDTFTIDGIFNRQLLDVSLQKRSNQLAPVEVTAQRPDYTKDSMERRYWFGSIMDERKTHGLGAVASPISGLYDALSKRQKRKWRFQKIYDSFEEQHYIESRMPPLVVKQLTGLDGDSLDVFMYWYNPAYIFVRNATDYELYSDIKSAGQRFRLVNWNDIKSPAPIRLQDDEENSEKPAAE